MVMLAAAGNGAVTGTLAEVDEMTSDEVQRMLDVWVSTAQRQHEDQVAALAIFREVHGQVSHQCAAIQREVMDRVEIQSALGVWWRSIAMLILGLLGGLGTVGVPVAVHLSAVDAALARIIDRQDRNTAEIAKLHDQDRRLEERLYQRVP